MNRIKLSDDQYAFIECEFGLSLGDIIEMSADEVRELREKCFNIEIEEAAKADNEGSAISLRGDYASELVDITLAHLKSQKPVAV